MTRARGNLITVLGLAVLCGGFPAGGQGLAGKLMTDSQDWWPADFGHYGPLFVRMT